MARETERERKKNKIRREGKKKKDKWRRESRRKCFDVGGLRGLTGCDWRQWTIIEIPPDCVPGEKRDEKIFHLIFPRHDAAADDENMMENSPVNDKWIISPSSHRHDFDEFSIDLFLLMPYELCKQFCLDLHAEERAETKAKAKREIWEWTNVVSLCFRGLF